MLAEFIESLWQDIHYAARVLLKMPGFAAVSVFSIALGISANTTVFSWIEALLLRPLPGVARGEELVTLETLTPSHEFIDSSYPDFRDYRAGASSLAGLIAFHDRPLSLMDGDRAQRVWAELVSGNFFDVLGVKPLKGRFFLPQEQGDEPGANPVAVLSANLWKGRFNSDPDIIGRVIQLNRQPVTVIGVAPEQFKGTIVGLAFDFWVPLTAQAQLTGGWDWLNSRTSRPLHLMARLKAGSTLESARAEVATIAQRLAKQYPNSNEGISATLLPVWKAPYGAQSKLSLILRILQAASAVVLVIVCANLTNLLLARATARRKEISVRLALGSSRFRLGRQLVTESLFLAVVGSGLGVLLSLWMTNLLSFFIPGAAAYFPVVLVFHLNGGVLVFSVLLCMIAGVSIGLLPAWQMTRVNLHDTLKATGISTTAGGNTRWLRGMLVMSEVALALVALTAAGLLIASFRNARRVDTGFDSENVLLVGLNLSASGYGQEQGKNFCRQLRDRLEQLPGVQAVSYAEDVPLGLDGGSWENVEIPGYLPAASENMRIYRNLVAPGYFDLMRIPIVEGREFAPQDNAQVGSVAIVNETFVRRYFAGRSPLARQFKAWERELTIVGVAKDIKYQSIGESPRPYFYVPLDQFYGADTGIGLHVRTAGPPAHILDSVRQQVRSQDPSVISFAEIALKDYVGTAYFGYKMTATLLSVLGGMALLLAALGLYSVLAYLVSQRRREIGIRVALGAQNRDIVHLVVQQGMRFVLPGLVAGLAATIGSSRLLQGMLLGIGPNDPRMLLGIAAILTAVALLAAYLPARTAMKVDPMRALREE